MTARRRFFSNAAKKDRKIETGNKYCLRKPFAYRLARSRGRCLCVLSADYSSHEQLDGLRIAYNNVARTLRRNNFVFSLEAENGWREVPIKQVRLEN
jgi:hypothetical protein